MREKVVLVIDDDDMNLQIAKMVLEKKVKCRVICVDNGFEGLNILKNERVSLVLLDILMPEFDGIETLQEIRADDKLKDTAVMMLTAAGGLENIKKVYHLGVKDYIKKPFMPADLVSRVTKKLAELEPEKKVLLFGKLPNELQEMQKIIEKNFDYDTLTALTESDTRKILRENEIALVIVDSHIKFIDAFWILKYFSANDKLNKIPVAVTDSEKLTELLEKLNAPKIDEKIDEPVAESLVIRTEKNKLARVVTSLVGYELDVHI